MGLRRCPLSRILNPANFEERPLMRGEQPNGGSGGLSDAWRSVGAPKCHRNIRKRQ
jgi:hypothetical protein